MKNLFVALFAALFFAACATTSAPKDAAEGIQLAGPQVSASAEPEPKQVEAKVSSRAKLLFEDALRAYEKQKKANQWDYESLEKKFEQALEADNTLAEAQYNLGVISERQGKPDRAVEHYRAALRAKPTLKQAAENLAVIAQNAGDLQGAVGVYQDILKHYPEDASARARLAEIYRRAQDHERATELARQALMREPKSMLAYKVMMLSYLDRKQLAMSKLVALRALKINDQDPELYHTVGLVMAQEGESEKARAQFKKAVEVRPDYLPSHFVLAKLALDAEDYPSAEEHLRKILQSDGKNAEAHLNLGVVFKGMGQFDKAMQEYDLAQKLKPDLAAVALNRGIILHRHKDAPERGLELYQQYLRQTGGEAAVSADAPVFGLIKEAEQLIQAKAEMKRAEEEAKKMEELAKKQEEAAKAEEDRQKKELERVQREQKEAEFKAAQETAKGKGVAAAEKPDKKAGKDAKGEPTPDAKDEPKVEAKKEDPKKKDAKAAPEVVPAKGTPPPTPAPSDEPLDDL